MEETNTTIESNWTLSIAEARMEKSGSSDALQLDDGKMCSSFEESDHENQS